MGRPTWTVYYNIVSPECDKWVGTGYEFFDTKEQAEAAQKRLTLLGNVVGVRPFYKNDEPHLGAAHRYF